MNQTAVSMNSGCGGLQLMAHQRIEHKIIREVGICPLLLHTCFHTPHVRLLHRGRQTLALRDAPIR